MRYHYQVQYGLRNMLELSLSLGLQITGYNNSDEILNQGASAAINRSTDLPVTTN